MHSSIWTLLFAIICSAVSFFCACTPFFCLHTFFAQQFMRCRCLFCCMLLPCFMRAGRFATLRAWPCNLARLALQPCAPGLATLRAWLCNFAGLALQPCASLAPLPLQRCATKSGSGSGPFRTGSTAVARMWTLDPEPMTTGRTDERQGLTSCDICGRLRCCVCMACLIVDVPPGGIKHLVWSLPSSP